jgi:hypothetical protein
MHRRLMMDSEYDECMEKLSKGTYTARWAYNKILELETDLENAYEDVDFYMESYYDCLEDLKDEE